MTTLLEPGPGDLEVLLALSNAHEEEIGWFTKEAFAELVALSFRTRMTREREAFVIALSEHAPANAPNWRWFAARFARFVYIDRVVVQRDARKRGLATLLYNDVMAAARAAGHTLVCCEVNLDPPNPGSDAFHTRMGFAEIGRAWLPDRAKTVRYLMRDLAADS